MKRIIDRHKYHWGQREYQISFVLGVVFFLVSLLINHYASNYVDKHAGAYVQDIFLDNLPVLNVDWIINDGVIIYSLFIIVYLLANPKKSPFALKSMALFVFIRSIFITLTHLGPAPSQTYLDPEDLLIKLNAGRDMFFSGHTGLPYLLALVFWNDKLVRYISIAASVIFGASVLLGHLHYSIDVFAAFFITYTIFHLCQKFFPKDYELSLSKPVS